MKTRGWVNILFTLMFLPIFGWCCYTMYVSPVSGLVVALIYLNTEISPPLRFCVVVTDKGS